MSETLRCVLTIAGRIPLAGQAYRRISECFPRSASQVFPPFQPSRYRIARACVRSIRYRAGPSRADGGRSGR